MPPPKDPIKYAEHIENLKRSHLGIQSIKPNTFKDAWKYIEIKGEDECWGWKGYKIKNGYGRITINRKTYLSHRLIYILSYGEIAKGICVCHKCDNPACCNPKHLFLGTHKDNMNDMINKGRQKILKGEKCGKSKLTEENVREIRRLYATGNYIHKELEKIFNISDVTPIIHKKTWREVI